MPTDSKRRDVARWLRHAWTNVPDRDPVRHQLRVLLEVYEAVGLDDGESDAIDLFGRLADLIEPSCDRDALLALADELDSSASMLLKQNDLDPNRKRRGMRRDHAKSLMAASDRIREACGEAVRNG